MPVICRPIRVCQELLSIEKSIQNSPLWLKLLHFFLSRESLLPPIKEKVLKVPDFTKIFKTHTQKNPFIMKTVQSISTSPSLSFLFSLPLWLLFFLTFHLSMSHFMKFIQRLFLLNGVVCKNCTFLYTTSYSITLPQRTNCLVARPYLSALSKFVVTIQQSFPF